MGSISHATALGSARDGMSRPRALLRAHRDERLVSQLRGGNERAFEALFDRYRPRLLAFCRGMLHSSEDAEDVLQEVFAAAHSAILADDRKLDVRPWLYRIARNRCLNHMRRPQPEAQEGLDEHPHSSGATTEDRAEGREDLRLLVRNIRELPEAQRSALLLRELEALSYREIAATLETSVPAVKSLLVRARVSLAEASQANDLSCSQVRFELAAAAEGIGKTSGAVRHHVRRCSDCRDYRTHLRSTTRGLAALAPIGPVLLLKRVLEVKLGGSGGGASVAGGASSGGTGLAGGAGAAGAGMGGAAAVGGAGLLGTKAATGAAVAVLFGAGGATVAVTEPELPSPASIVAAVSGTQPVSTPGPGAEGSTSTHGPGHPGPSGTPGSSDDTKDEDDESKPREPEEEPAGEEPTATPPDPGTDYSDPDAGGETDGQDPLAARRERLRELLAQDRLAARLWWQHHGQNGHDYVGTGPNPDPPQPPTDPQPPANPPPPPSDPPAPEPPPAEEPEPETAKAAPPGDE